MKKIKEELQTPAICFIVGIITYLIVYRCGTM